MKLIVCAVVIASLAYALPSCKQRSAEGSVALASGDFTAEHSCRRTHFLDESVSAEKLTLSYKKTDSSSIGIRVTSWSDGQPRGGFETTGKLEYDVVTGFHDDHAVTHRIWAVHDARGVALLLRVGGDLDETVVYYRCDPFPFAFE